MTLKENMNVEFYWEKLGQHYEFDSDKKYLIYFRGCFGPPTRGHFNTINDFTHLPNANFFIHQGGDQRRHGVPFYLSNKIWQIYIKELMPRDRTILMRRGRYQITDMLNHPYTREADVVVFIAGDEDYDPNTKEESDRERKYYSIFRELGKIGKPIVFLYLTRNKEVLSATTFVNKIREGESTNELKIYLPEHLSDKGIRYIIRKLRECDLY